MSDNQFSFEDALFNMEDSQHVQPSSEDMPFPSDDDFKPQAPLFTSLTPAEEQNLQSIAMPYLFSKTRICSEPSSPTLSHSSHSPSPSPEPAIRTRKTQKRKSAILDQDLPGVCQSRKRGHNAIEKRYRTNLNDKINCLREGIPPLCKAPSLDAILDEAGEEADDSEGEGVDKKYGKAAILTRALEYIQHLESTTQRLGAEVMVLKTRVGAFERLAMSGSTIPNIGTGSPPSYQLAAKCETLESIKDDFIQIPAKIKETVPKSSSSRKRMPRLSR